MASRGSGHRVVVNSSPVIYLAKLEALDVFPVRDPALITEGVRREVLVPQAAVRFPEMVSIDRAIDEGRLVLADLDQEEQAVAEDIASRIPGLGLGERESMAVAIARGLPVVLHDRRASRVGRAWGVQVIGPLDLLFERTDDERVLGERIRAFARLVDMRLETLEQLSERVKERSRW